MGVCHLSLDSILPWKLLQNSTKQTHSYNKLIPTSPLTKMINQHNQTKILSINHSSSPGSQITTTNSGYHSNSTDFDPILLFCAENGYVEEAQMLWDETLNSSFTPSFHLVSSIITACAKTGHFDLISDILTQIKNRSFSWLPQVYALAIKCFGAGGRLDCMEQTLNDMVSMGFRVDSVTGNAYVVYYSMFGSLAEMEFAYGRLKKSRIILEEEGIRGVSMAYIKGNKFYALGKFLKDVGLGRRNVGNLLWNLLLLSYAARFKMKSLQREFLAMLEAGFRPDLTTFNIRALAFSKMNLFWDLHLSLDHMRHENVVPDLVTYGCLVDAYMDKRMGRNLDFALKKMINLDEAPSVATESFVFEAMGKGEFHMNSEAFMEFNRDKRWTYRKLIGVHLKKQHRSNQIFWNY
ncbi:pentatricopeptide repeat-containing protein At3g42630-like [Chenopodium quinoa]|uniref:pentatricopeptide repeat-containing protein At3g42630-like n=1 Tax=Chenopodium quinoa TaxID=63459 RepID=UPI000B782EDB|nr:pentatricopeptide repeat-containing protein At3g42630-like [Chenopodium quinoa]